MFLEERALFFLEGFSSMMLCLICDVVTDRLNIRFADTEGPITGLPGKSGKLGSLVLQPF